MARYYNDIPFSGDPNKTFESVKTYLEGTGFEYIDYAGEYVFKKGKGVLVAPTFVKVSFFGAIARVEAWIKYALLPGVYVGEIGMEGFVGAAVKGTMKKAVAQVEQMIRQGDTYPSYDDVTVEEIHADPYATPVQKADSLSDYIENYAEEKTRKDIKSVAILCYVCGGITAVSAIAFNPIALIDAALIIGLALGMHKKKSKGCAIAILVLAIYEVVIALIVTGQLAGWVWVVAGIWAVITFNHAEKAYKEHLRG